MVGRQAGLVKLDDMEVPDEAFFVGEGFVGNRRWVGSFAPESEQTAEFNKRSQKALANIVMSVSSSLIYLITSCEKPADAWKTLRDHFERDSLVNKLMLKKRYFRMEMKEGTSVETHMKCMKEVTDQLAAINAPISEEDQVVTLLGSLPPRYSNWWRVPVGRI